MNFNCSSSTRSRQSESSIGDPTSDPVHPTSDPVVTEQSVTLLSESHRENFTLRVVLEGVIKPVNRSVIVRPDQKKLYDTLGDVYINLEDMLHGGQFFWQADDLLVTALEMVEEHTKFVGVTCDSDQLIREEDVSFACCKFESSAL